MPQFLGDRLMVLKGSSMIPSYPDGCAATVKENRIIRIEDRSIFRGGNSEDMGFIH